MIVNGWDVDVGQVLAADYEAGTVFRVADLIAAIVVDPGLFTAAPDLLAACRVALATLEKSHSWAIAEEAAGIVRAAIARAEGEEPE